MRVKHIGETTALHKESEMVNYKFVVVLLIVMAVFNLIWVFAGRVAEHKKLCSNLEMPACKCVDEK